MNYPKFYILCPEALNSFELSQILFPVTSNSRKLFQMGRSSDKRKPTTSRSSSHSKKLKSKHSEITDESEIESDEFRQRQKDWHELTPEQIEEFRRRDLLDWRNEFRRGETFNHTDKVNYPSF